MSKESNLFLIKCDVRDCDWMVTTTEPLDKQPIGMKKLLSTHLHNLIREHHEAKNLTDYGDGHRHYSAIAHNPNGKERLIGYIFANRYAASIHKTRNHY